MPSLQLRPYRPADLLALYDICLRTGASGEDASSMYRHPMLLGHQYVAPYATLCPEYTFVLEDGQRVQGYVVGVPDSADFARRCEAEWFPLLRGLYPLPEAEDRSPDAAIICRLHRGIPAPGGSWGPQYPAHLHIDLLPAAQGGGHGRRLMVTLFGRLREGGAAGVHLGVGRSNVRAQGFYGRLGFTVLEEDEGGLTLGLTL